MAKNYNQPSAAGEQAKSASIANRNRRNQEKASDSSATNPEAQDPRDAKIAALEQEIAALKAEQQELRELMMQNQQAIKEQLDAALVLINSINTAAASGAAHPAQTAEADATTAEQADTVVANESEKSAKRKETKQKLGLFATMFAAVRSGMTWGRNRGGARQSVDAKADADKPDLAEAAEALQNNGSSVAAEQANQTKQTKQTKQAQTPVTGAVPMRSAVEAVGGNKATADNKNQGKGGRFTKAAAVIGGLALAAILGGGVVTGQTANAEINNTRDTITAKADSADSVDPTQAAAEQADYNKLVDKANNTQAGWFGRAFYGPSQEAVDNAKAAASNSGEVNATYQAKTDEWNAAQAAGVTLDDYNAYKDKAGAAGIDIPTYKDLEAKANGLGDSVEDYQNYSNYAQKTGLTVEQVKAYAKRYGVASADLGTVKAGVAMNDNVTHQGNVLEPYVFTDDVNEAKAQVKFAGTNSPESLAMYYGGMIEDGVDTDKGIDGLEDPYQIINLAQTLKNNPDEFSARSAEFIQMIDNADSIVIRDATSMRGYSYYTDGDDLYVSRTSENSGGTNEKVVEISGVNKDGGRYSLIIKMSCGQTWAGEYIPTTTTIFRRPPTAETPPAETPPAETPPTDNNPPKDNPPESKDPNADDPSEKDDPDNNWGNNAPGGSGEATEDEQAKGDDGKINTDSEGNANGLQPSDPSKGDASDDSTDF